MGLRIACISGWGQPANALESLVPERATATHVDYARHDSVSAAILHIAEKARGCNMVVGWSLGGQLALRAIASGMLKPERLVLLSTPFQFVKNESLPIGMPTDTFAKFQENYAKNPERTLKKAWELIAKDDTNAETVQNRLNAQDKTEVLNKNWGHWLEILQNYSCKELHTAETPPTILVHGNRDLVVFHEQSEQLMGILPAARLETLPGCGHAPHWHAPEHLKALIEHHASPL
ncbi:MAG: alpha/beta hydrolase [Rickettsiales bacterium]|nr:alpha/beta hydrolase [Rickettsiales bacterium]